MKKLPLLLAILFTALLVSPCMADNESVGRYSYIQIESAVVDVVNLNNVSFDVNYDVDDDVNFLVFLLGKNDLKDKLCDIFGLEDCRFDIVDLDHAVFYSNIQSFNNGDGTYWFPEMSFKIEVPNVTVKAQENYKIFDSIQNFPGIGYYFGRDNSTATGS